jgi:hypothetical protein
MNQKKVMALEIARRLEQRGLIDAAAHWYALANQVSVSLAFVRFAALRVTPQPQAAALTVARRDRT